MATRQTKLITRNSDIVNRPLPSSLIKGEAIVNTAEGIVFYSGITSSTNEWTPAGTGSTANFFEVGSNLYDLRLRNRITEYEGFSGANLVGKFLSGTTNGFVLANIGDIAGVDTFVDAFSYSDNTLTIGRNQGQPDLDVIIDSFTGLTITGDFNVSGDTSLTDVTANSIDAATILSGGTNLSDIISSTDTFSTGLTYNPSSNQITLEGNNAYAPLSVEISSVSGLTFGNLTSGRVVYVGAGGELTDEGGFEYDATTNTLLSENINTSASGSAFVGTGGLVVGSGGDVDTPGSGDVVIHGNLTIFGDAITASTGQLYVEDNNIILNYNPGSDTSSSSVGAGFTIQDGDGVNGDVSLDIRAMNGFTGLTVGEVPDISEYSGPTGVSNRAFVTQLNDIVIRSNDITTPNGVRVLAEFDVLDGGSY